MEGHLDKTREDPVPYRKMVLLVNNFVVTNVRFLNRFSALCEDKLAKISEDITRMDITMSILEAKVNSIEYIDKTIPTATPPPPSSSTTASSMNQGSSVPPPPPPPQQQQSQNQSQTTPTTASPPAADVQGPKFYKRKDHPDYKKYFKMLAVGIPERAVAMKMQMEGVDSDLLHDPEFLTDTPMEDEEQV